MPIVGFENVGVWKTEKGDLMKDAETRIAELEAQLKQLKGGITDLLPRNPLDDWLKNKAVPAAELRSLLEHCGEKQDALETTTQSEIKWHEINKDDAQAVYEAYTELVQGVKESIRPQLDALKKRVEKRFGVTPSVLDRIARGLYAWCHDCDDRSVMRNEGEWGLGVCHKCGRTVHGHSKRQKSKRQK